VVFGAEVIAARTGGTTAKIDAKTAVAERRGRTDGGAPSRCAEKTAPVASGSSPQSDR
jgi:hypothetical protein